MGNQPIDAKVRQQALDVRGSFAVSAPAGSGKTGLLTQRMLNLLAHTEQPENILAMTFTRKAADEMHQRIVSALQLAASDEQADNSHEQPHQDSHQQRTLELARAVLTRDRERDWRLLLTPHRLRIQTIDSFCQYLVDQLPIHSGVHAALRTTENPDHLYQYCVRDFFALLDHPAYQQDMAVLLAHVDNNLLKLERLLVELLRKRNQWLGVLFKNSANDDDKAGNILRESLQRHIVDSLAACEQIMKHHLPDLLPLLRYSAEQAQNFELAQLLENFHGHTGHIADNLKVWKALADAILTKNANPDSCNIRKTVDARSGFPSSNDKNSLEYGNRQAMLALLKEFAGNTILLACLRDVKAMPSLQSHHQQPVIDSLTRLLPRLVAQFQLTCREQGVCDFDEIAQGAVAALGDEQAPTDLALRLDYQIKHILVDEFQDTSLLQLNLLEKLTTGWQAGDGRTLFVVGDAMQSCYGFRDAKVGLFLRVRRQGIGTVPLTPLDLVVNFRSHATIVDWVNGVFSQVLPQRDNLRRGAVSYRMAKAKSETAEPQKNNQSSVQPLGFWETAEQSARIVELIKKHLQESETDTIALLARNRSHLPHLLAALRDAAIDWEAQDVDALRSQMAIVDLLSLTKAVSDVSDRISWLAILRAPWCGLDMQDLFILTNNTLANSHEATIWQCIVSVETLPLSDEGKLIVKRLRDILTAAFANSYRKPFRQWLEGIWLALGGPANIANHSEIKSAHHYFDLVEQQCGSWGIDNWEIFEQALDRLYATSPQTSRLQVMTLHKAKGLEFDVVILPHLEKTPRSDTKDLLLWEDTVDENGNINFLLSATATHGDTNSLYDYLWREQNIARDLESARLLYVACTRAIKHLYLCACLPEDNKAPSPKSLLAKLWPYLQDEFVALVPSTPATTSQQENQTRPVLSKILRLPHARDAVVFPVDPTLAPYRRPPYFQQLDFPSDDALINRYQRYCGTVIHRALEIACRNGWQDFSIEKYRPFWSVQLRQLGVPDTALESLLHNVQHAVELTLADTTGQWLLDNNHQDSVCEWCLSGVEINADVTRPQEWIIDRSFVDKGIRWVIDYKSSLPAANQSETAFFIQEENLYRDQLRAYCQAVYAYDPSYPVRTALYFPRLAKFYPLST